MHQSGAGVGGVADAMAPTTTGPTTSEQEHGVMKSQRKSKQQPPMQKRSAPKGARRTPVLLLSERKIWPKPRRGLASGAFVLFCDFCWSPSLLLRLALDIGEVALFARWIHFACVACCSTFLVIASQQARESRPSTMRPTRKRSHRASRSCSASMPISGAFAFPNRRRRRYA